MAQYCRYCEYAWHVMKGKSKMVYCQKKSKTMTEKQSKHTNDCKEYELNPIDVLRMNEKGYKPTGIKPVALGGLGKQIRLEEVMDHTVEATRYLTEVNKERFEK